MQSTLNNPVFEKVFRAVAATAYIDDLLVTPSTRILEDLGLGDFGRFRLTLSIEDAFDFDLPDDAVRSFVTIDDIVAFLSSRRLATVKAS
jgi:acyl carrier protein